MVKDEVKPAENLTQQSELLNLQAEKAVKKYRQYQGYERQMKIKQNLYRKGFDLDDIDDWITEHNVND